MAAKAYRNAVVAAWVAWVAACLMLLLSLTLTPQLAYADDSSQQNPLVDFIRQGEGYSAVLYDNTNGLPTSEANDIVQTDEGFIWIGSYGGLVRYDGNTFERMEAKAGFGSVTCLHVDSQNRLWIGSSDSGVAMIDGGTIQRWREEDGLGADKICDLEEGLDGSIYVGTSEGLTIITPDLTLQAAVDRRVSSSYIDRTVQGGNGLLYCLTNEDDYFTLRKGKLTSYVDHDKSSFKGITCIFPDPKDPEKLYFGMEGSEVYYGDPLSPSDMELIDISPLYEVKDMSLISDALWICARNGIGFIDDDGFHHLSNVPLNNAVDHVMEDYEGNLWFTSSRQGVMKLVINQFSDVFAQLGLGSTVVNSTCMYDGKLFIGADDGLVVADGEELVPTVPLSSAKSASGVDLGATDLIELLRGCRIRSIIRDSKGRLWISTWRSQGLLRYDGGNLTAFTERDGLLSNHVRTVSEASDGSMLVACSGGVSIIQGDRVTASYVESDGIDNPETLCVCAAPNGDILLGSNGGGIYVINKAGVRCVGMNDGLTSGVVMRIKHDEARGVFWIVAGNALAYMTEDYQVTTVEEFPSSNNFDLYENSVGEMWVLGGDGIYVAPTEELLANGAIDAAHYNLAHGLPYIATSNSYSELTPEGDLYIAGYKGVVRVNIESPLLDVSDIRQAVPFVDADGVRFYPDAEGTFTVPSRTHKLTVHGYVLTSSLTEPQLSYCLKGFDEEPVSVRRSELGPVSYTNLPGGSYQFEMKLSDALGQGGKTLSVTIVKERALHEMLWFKPLVAAVCALLIAMLVRMYYQRQMRIMAQKNREEAEKERIANELHLANRIQASMLPSDFPPFPSRHEFDIYASMDPAREVGGDFYDFFMLDADHLCLVMADVSGKGIPASLFMMISKVTLQGFAGMGISVAEILSRTNESLCANNAANMFVTVWVGILEISTGKIVAANAGHEYPALRRAGAGFELLKDKHGLVLGMMEGMVYSEYELNLEPGDKLFLYTDGVPEAMDANEKMFGLDRMVDALNENPDAAPHELLTNVRQAVDRYVGDAEQFDDLTMLCIEYLGPSA